MKNELINPYANALDGLDIKDPVSDFFNFCKKNHWELDITKTYNLLKTLKDIYNGEERHDIKNSRPRLIKIKAMKQIETKVSKVEYQGETPF